jgi:3-hydroxyisobutyrate dehydrogenase-like beta-hydroxyacid dehydrogenase
MTTTIGVLHPGEMGAGVAGALAKAGHRVVWASNGRSPDTKERAEAAGLVDVGDVATLFSQADVVMSICPPHAALDVAREVHGFAGLYVDANAISPAHAAQVAAIVMGAGATYVDGGIIGSPPPSASTRLYLSGERAGEVAALVPDDVVTKVLDESDFAASALKMAYAAWTKGTAAMMLDIRAMARANGVEASLVEQWGESSPELLGVGRRAARQAEDRGWRWIGEMAEIASSFTDAGLPGGFHEASGEIYSRVPRKMDATVDDETLAEVVDLLLRRS